MNRGRLREWVLILGLAASVGTALWVRGAEEDGAVVAAAVIREDAAPSPAAETPPQRLFLERLNPRTQTASDIDPFRAKIWYVAPPPPPAAPPPKPTAPPLPFQYVGKSEDADGKNLMVFLTKGNESYTVKPGETFDGAYRLEGIEKGRLVILYQPLSEIQRLTIGSNE